MRSGKSIAKAGSADGSYEIVGVPSVGRVFVRAGALNAAMSEAVEVKSPGPLDFTLEAGHVIAGRVVLRGSGKPVAGAHIQLKSLAEPDPSSLPTWFNDRDQTIVLSGSGFFRGAVVRLAGTTPHLAIQVDSRQLHNTREHDSETTFPGLALARAASCGGRAEEPRLRLLKLLRMLEARQTQ